MIEQTIAMLTLKTNKLSSNYAKDYLVATIMLLFIFICNIDTSIAVKCYRCAVVSQIKYTNTGQELKVHPCSMFDESDKFIVDCNYSTMCLKTISTTYLQNGQTQETITRDCAHQTEKTQVFRNGRWEPNYTVVEAYQEGCKNHGENYLGASFNTECYCRDKLCNAGARQVATYMFVMIVSVISLLQISIIF